MSSRTTSPAHRSEADLELRLGALESRLREVETKLDRVLRAYPLPKTVVLEAFCANPGWSIVFHLPEPACEPEVRFEGQPFRILPSPHPDQAQITLGGVMAFADVRPGTFTVSYRAALENVERGPFEVPFDPDRELVRSHAKWFEQIPEWLAFRRRENHDVEVWFTSILTHKAALREVRIAIDDVHVEPLRFSRPADVRLRWRPQGVGDEDEMFRVVPANTKAVAVQLVYLDGSESAWRRAELAGLMR